MKSMMTGRLGAVEPQPGVRRKVGTATGFLAAVLLGVATIAAPNLAQAAGHGGGGGFHAGGGFHGGGFAVEDFPAAAFTSTQRRAREWVEFMTTGFVMDRLAAA
jgi:hypothetical protein